jgi:DUF971 family protein
MEPTKIAVSRKRGVLELEWDDGHHSEMPLAGLRAACPCAECRGGHANMGAPGSPEMLMLPLNPIQSDQLESLEVVGNYALQLIWGDGHAYGIYSWELLRQLCPCGDEIHQRE